MLACDGGRSAEATRAVEARSADPSTLDPTARAMAGPAAPTRLETRIVRFDGGEARIESGVLSERIEISRDGRVRVESSCAGPVATYDAIAAFFARFKDAVASDDRAGVVSMLKFPLRVNGVKPPVVMSADELLARWDRVFTRRVKRKISLAEPRDVVCRDGSAAMFGSGVLWADVFDTTLRVKLVGR